MSDDLIVGIDLGTTNSLISVVDSGFPIVLAGDDGRRLLPSVVSFRDDEILVGDSAVRGRELNPAGTVSSIKRVIGRRFGEMSETEIASLPFRVVRGEDDSVLVDLGGGEVKTAEEVSAAILRRLREIAESALEVEVKRAVITVPAYFGHRQREATRSAAEVAGWEVERIFNEPTAAALAYGLNEGAERQRIAVYDLGGGTFDLSVLELRDGVFEVLATSGDTCLGGDDIDQAISDWIIGELDLDDEAFTAEKWSILRSASRRAKEKLSDSDSTTVSLPFFDGEKSFELVLSRDQLNRLALPILERTRVITRQALHEAGQKGEGDEKIDHLILVGGSTRMPLVREKLEEWTGIEPNVSQHPDEAVAIGAGIQAGILCGRVKQVVLLDVVPLSLGIETIGGLMNVIIPRNTTIPCKAGELFTNAVSGQKSMAVRILQGERELARDNWLLGEIEVPFSPAPKGSARVGVQFEIDENGMLTVLARNTQTGEDQLLRIENSAIDVEDEAVEKMVSESIDHAFDDMNARILAEARLKSEELLPAVDAALTMAGEQLPDEERVAIVEATRRVRQLIEMEAPSIEQLKQANADLDDKTQTLAAILVELAMDQAFEES